MIRTFPCGLKDNHACKWISHNYPGMLTYVLFLENCQESICIMGSSPIPEERSLFFFKVWDRFIPYIWYSLGPFLVDWRTTMHANGFMLFSRNNTYVGIPGRLSEIHLHACLFSNPQGKVLIIVGISCSLDLRVQLIQQRWRVASP